MNRINLFTFLMVKFLKKSYGASNKFHFPKYVKSFFYGMYFRLLQRILDPYLCTALCNIKHSDYTGTTNSNIIWIFWWQGYDNMPLIVKRCVTSIKRHANGHKVILITKKNITKYTNIPEYIYDKVEKRYITLTHFSDILRFNLLNNYGGLWCDATLYCTSHLDGQYFNYLYTSGGYTNTEPKFAKGHWTGFLIGGNQYNALFKFMCNYFNLYWKDNRYQIDYFLIDLGLHYAYLHNIGNFKLYVNNVACYHNPNMFKLAPLLNKRYNYKMIKYLTKNTNMFKITYKIDLNKNMNTVYNQIVNK